MDTETPTLFFGHELVQARDGDATQAEVAEARHARSNSILAWPFPRPLESISLEHVRTMLLAAARQGVSLKIGIADMEEGKIFQFRSDIEWMLQERGFVPDYTCSYKDAEQNCHWVEISVFGSILSETT